jgi:tRNA pseudouridine38-40 synthase
MQLRRARFVIAYDGAGFHGVVETPGMRTVLGELRVAMEKVVRTGVQMIVAGRTDTGVHGWGQVLSGDLPAEVDLANLSHRLNRMCGPEIVIRDARWADRDSFNARYDACWRHYRYHVWNAPVGNPHVAASAWHVVPHLQLDLMRLACDPLIGEHDFTSFCRRPKGVDGVREPTMVRRILEARWSAVASDYAVDGARLLRLDIRATSFCHQMVRSITGLLVEVGMGNVTAGEVRAVLLSRNRAIAGQVAPAHGLCLWEVGY